MNTDLNLFANQCWLSNAKIWC